MSDTLGRNCVPNMKKITKDEQVVVQSHEQTPSLVMTGDNTHAKNYVPEVNKHINKRSFVASSQAKYSVQNSRLYEGRLIVNGFHPQLATVPSNYYPSKELLKELPRVTSKKRTLDQRISNMVDECRKIEQTEMHKRQRVSPLDLIPPCHHCEHDRDSPLHGLAALEPVLSDSYTDSFMKSHVPQLIATIGGRGASCNIEFLKICGASLQEPSESFTLFNLIVPSLRFKLFELFSRAVSDQISMRPTKDDNPQKCLSIENNSRHANGVASVSPDPSTTLKEKMYMSITLPCIALPASKLSQNVTIILMDDKDLDNRCFLSILSPISIKSQGSSERPPGSRRTVGDIEFVCRNQLLNLLKVHP